MTPMERVLADVQIGATMAMLIERHGLESVQRARALGLIVPPRKPGDPVRLGPLPRGKRATPLLAVGMICIATATIMAYFAPTTASPAAAFFIAGFCWGMGAMSVAIDRFFVRGKR